ncbi:MAG: hypothetical protein R6X32_09390 [Chloroflexota bacterium]
MKKFEEWLENMPAEQKLWLTAVFASVMLGTMLSSLILQWGMSQYGSDGILAQLAVCLLSTLAYGGVVVLVFYTLIPEARLAVNRILSGKE